MASRPSKRQKQNGSLPRYLRIIAYPESLPAIQWLRARHFCRYPETTDAQIAAMAAEVALANPRAVSRSFSCIATLNQDEGLDVLNSFAEVIASGAPRRSKALV